MKKILPWILIGLVVAAAGCSQRPSDARIQAAIQADVRDNLSQVDQLAGRLGGDSAVRLLRQLGSPDPDKVTVAHLDVLDSQRLSGGDYNLHVRYDIVTPDSSQAVTRDIQLRRTDNGWRAVPHQR